MEVLFLAHRIPFPPDKGDKVRSHRWLRALGARYPVHLGCFIDDANDRTHLDELSGFCASVYAAPLPRWKITMRGVRALVEGEALTAAVYRHAGLARWIEERLQTGRIGCIVAFSSAMAGYCGARGARLGRILDFVDVDSEKWRLMSARSHGAKALLYRREATRLLTHDRQAMRLFDIGCFISAAEVERFRMLAPEAAGRLRLLRNGVDAGFFAPERDYPDPYGPGGPVVALAGVMDYWPNEEAAMWFVSQVLPHLRSEVPALRFAIVGRAPSRRVRRLAASPGVRVVGAVADMRPYLAHAAAVVAPLPAAIGVPNKILEGMAMARPVIATPQALSGLDLERGRDLLIAEGPVEFAAAVRDAIAGIGPMEGLGRRARQRVIADYDWDRVERQMQALVAEFGISTGQEAPRYGAIA